MYRTDAVEGASGPSSGSAFAAEAPLTVQARTRLERATKRGLDITAALFFLIVGSPMYALIALGVKLSSPGPVHFWQYRVGRSGRRFRFYKFRSMYVDGDEKLRSLLAMDQEANLMWQEYQKLPNDPRTTRFGRFIRRTSLDEVPQFWNVLRGDMSLVGPRPCMEQQDSFYGKYWAAYCSMKPGLTGLWQVSGRNRLSYRQRVQLDARYVDEWSIWLDIRILGRTITAVLSGDGSH